MWLAAEIAQSVEHFTRNEGVVGSSPIFSFSQKIRNTEKYVRPESICFWAFCVKKYLQSETFFDLVLQNLNGFVKAEGNYAEYDNSGDNHIQLKNL